MSAAAIREWANEVLRLRHVLLHATGDEGERFRNDPGVWSLAAVRHVNEASVAAQRAAWSSGIHANVRPYVRSTLYAFSDFAKLARQEAVGSPDRVARLLASEPWQRLRASVDDLASELNSLPEAGEPAAAEQPESPAADNAAQDDDKAEAGDSAPDEYAALRRWAGDNLKGKQRRAIEMLADAGGSVPMADLASDPVIGWEVPYDDAAKSITRTLNGKLKGWKVYRQDNELRVKRVSKMPPS